LRADHGDHLLQQPDRDGPDHGPKDRAHPSNDEHADVPHRQPQRELIGLDVVVALHDGIVAGLRQRHAGAA